MKTTYHIHDDLVAAQELAVLLGDKLYSICSRAKDDGNLVLKLHELVTMINDIHYASFRDRHALDVVWHNGRGQLRYE